jgi:hypothetical protein
LLIEGVPRDEEENTAGDDTGSTGATAPAGTSRTGAAASSSTPTPKASGSAPKKATSTTKTSTATAPTELAVNDEIPMALPFHMWSWKDSINNDRVTCMLLLPVGTTKDMLTPRVVAGGDEIRVDYIWPEAMLNERIAMFMGSKGAHPFYNRGHIKVSHFRDSVKGLKRGDENLKVKSVFRADTPFTVEEQFTGSEVPSAVSVIKFHVTGKDGIVSPAKCLVMEMMGKRDSYVSAPRSIDEDDVCFSLENLLLG